MPAPIEDPAYCEIRAFISFLSTIGITAVEIHGQIWELYGQNIMKHGMVRKWVGAPKCTTEHSGITHDIITNVESNNLYYRCRFC